MKFSIAPEFQHIEVIRVHIFDFKNFAQKKLILAKVIKDTWEVWEFNVRLFEGIEFCLLSGVDMRFHVFVVVKFWQFESVFDFEFVVFEMRFVEGLHASD